MKKSITIICLSLCFLLFGKLFGKYIFSIRIVDGNSMMPTINNNDIVFIDMWTKKYQQFDMVVFDKKNIAQDHFLIKRIIGLPETQVYIDDFKVLVNGMLLAEKFSYNPFWDKDALECRYSEILSAKKNEYLVLGDNRCESSDSRNFGAISEDEIVGKVFFILKR